MMSLRSLFGMFSLVAMALVAIMLATPASAQDGVVDTSLEITSENFGGFSGDGADRGTTTSAFVAIDFCWAGQGGFNPQNGEYTFTLLESTDVPEWVTIQMPSDAVVTHQPALGPTTEEGCVELVAGGWEIRGTIANDAPNETEASMTFGVDVAGTAAGTYKVPPKPADVTVSIKTKPADDGIIPGVNPGNTPSTPPVDNGDGDETADSPAPVGVLTVTLTLAVLGAMRRRD